MKIAVFDIDDVVADYNEIVTYMLGKGSGEDVHYMNGRYSGKTTIMDMWRDPNYFYPLKESSGAPLVYGAANRGYDILFVTERPAAAESTTLRWLGKNLSVDFLGVKFTRSKVGAIVDLMSKGEEIAFFIDDNEIDVDEVGMTGVPSFCWGQPWNETVYPRLFLERGTDIVWCQQNDWEDAEPFWSIIGD